MGYRIHGCVKPLVDAHQPDMRPHAWRRYRLHEDYAVKLKSPSGERATLAIIEGTITDGASVPRMAWTASGLTPDGLLRAGALVHDWLYRKKGSVVFPDGQVHSIPRSDADAIFLDLMLAAGVPEWRAKLAYRAVRIFGRRW